MTYRSLVALGISFLAVSSTPSTAAARAGSDDGTSSVKKSKSDEAGWEEDAKASDAADEEAAPKPKSKSKVKLAADPAAAQEDAAPSAKEQPAAAPASAGDEAPPPPVETSELGPAVERPPIYGRRNQWVTVPYGYARLDMIEDSTQSFEDGIQPNLIQRVGTYRGDHRRTIITARDSRLGMFVSPPEYRGIRSFAQIEFDFFGLTPTDARRHDTVVFAPLRLRLAFLKLETKVVDIIAGQYYDLFGWNAYYYVGTVGYLGVPGEVYHRNPQLRVEKKLNIGPVELMLAAAAVRPGARDSGLPEGQFGLKLAVPGYTGASMFGFGRPQRQPLSIGLSGLYREFEMPVFRAEPGSQSVKTFGWGFAAQTLIPVIPIKSLKDRSNALTLVGEFTIGTGIADMYTFMDGGSRFPILPNPTLAQPAVVYQANVDPGLVTFDRNLNLATISWQAAVGNIQYFLPVDNGRLWIEGTYSRIWSNNIKDLTPFPSWGGIFTEMDYYDANLGFDITPAIALGLSFQSVHQTFGDLSAPTPQFGNLPIPDQQGVGLSVEGTGGVAASARNNRVQVSMALYF